MEESEQRMHWEEFVDIMCRRLRRFAVAYDDPNDCWPSTFPATRTFAGWHAVFDEWLATGKLKKEEMAHGTVDETAD